MSITTGSTALSTHRTFLHKSLWTTQFFLASLFVVIGTLKVGYTSERLVEVMPWLAGSPLWMVRGLGVLELIGAFALVVPTAAHVRERTAGWAALAFAALAVLTATINAANADLRVIPINLSLAVLAAFVAWGRGLHPEISA